MRGLQRFREHFRADQDCYVLIGGVACELWLSRYHQQFRPTRDVDMVLVLEALTSGFVDRLWDFIRAGQYTHRQGSTGRRVYYRFTHPAGEEYPAMIEVFCRRPSDLVMRTE